MRLKLPLILCVVVCTACAPDPVAKTDVDTRPSDESTLVASNVQDADQEPEQEAETADDKTAAKPAEEPAPKPPEKTPEELEAERLAAEKEKAAQREKEAREKLETLSQELTAAKRDWRTSLRTAKTAEERTEAMNNNPANEYGQKFFELYSAFPKTKIASQALNKAVIEGAGEGKTLAMNEILELANMDEDSDASQKSYLLLARSGTGEPQVKAMNRLLQIAEENIATAEGPNLLTQLISVRADNEPKSKALQRLLAVADEDIRSRKSAEYLVSIAKVAKGETKSAAMDRLLEHHIESEKILELMQPMARAMPSAENEKWLKDLCRKAEGHIKGNAIVTLSKFINRRNMYRDFYADAEPEVLESLGEDTIAYFQTELDPLETANLELMLDNFVSDHESLLENAKKELFVVQNLSIGKTAPNIVGTDLDGVEFQLTDYRGKVVFLDFWGDW